MNRRVFEEMTGKQVRTHAETTQLWAERDAALRVRLAGLPKAEAIALCNLLIASEYQGWSTRAVCNDYLAKANII